MGKPSRGQRNHWTTIFRFLRHVAKTPKDVLQNNISTGIREIRPSFLLAILLSISDPLLVQKVFLCGFTLAPICMSVLGDFETTNSTAAVKTTEPQNNASNETIAEEALSQERLETAESKVDRRRRLIPYATYYVLNNYVEANQPQQHQQNIVYATRRPALIQQHQKQYIAVRPAAVSKQPLRYTQQQQSSKQQTGSERFVPSVQYDPKNIGRDPDIFVPVRYTSPAPTRIKLKPPGHEEDYQSVTVASPTPPLRSTIPVPLTIAEPQYVVTTPRPVNFVTSAKPQATVELVYGPGATAEFESVRYVTAKPRHPAAQPASTRYLQQLRQQHQPVSLSHVIKSLQLTNRLPEVLNDDNIDSSIRTLEEILDILNAGKRENYVLAPVPLPPQPVHGKFKPAYTKPKVITESNYEATQISVTPHNELVTVERPRPYLSRPAHQYQTPSPIEQVIEIKRPSAYPTQVTTQMPDILEQLLQIRPVDSYSDRVKVEVPVSRDKMVEIKPIGPYNTVPVEDHTPISQEEEVVEIKPKSPYVKPIRTQSEAPPQNFADKPPSEEKKIVEYYIPIIQDIDEPTQQTPEKASSITPNSHHTENKYYVTPESSDGVIDDEKYTLPESTIEPEQKLTVSVPSIPPLLKYGVTRGKPHVDYPAYTEIPPTDFDCKQQRYKGFFGDPQTGCQVWHYCDLNGGKSSFLCPNGTIFSQVALTCDWWFNVKCEATTQLYVLNERLYKYILPIMPKFPEDFSGPEVDKYLELKFKELETKMKENRMKKIQEEKDQSTVNTLQSIEDS
ncbi:hypothetical protein QAD02_008878 [Eretmocerus hayati]|uniref:Uncharacterized protein n=1 Tax=Eretmocerus hayati TaxID=131215 RepID=A0ACC2N8I6_9HYME|nr:hypothetical protein QAD02_008878 [Eretmocerus hayati]